MIVITDGMNKTLLFTIFIVCLVSIGASTSYALAAEYTFIKVPRSYSGGVFLAHKRFVKKLAKESVKAAASKR